MAVPSAGVRARDTALVVEMLGWLQVVAGSVSGILLLMSSRNRSCVSKSEVIADKCYKYGTAWDVASVGGGVALIVGGVSSGCLFVMIAAYVRHQLRDVSAE